MSNRLFQRIVRVAAVLTAQPSFAALKDDPKQDFPVDGGIVQFPERVVKIAELLWNQNIDACTARSNVILAAAAPLFNLDAEKFLRARSSRVLPTVPTDAHVKRVATVVRKTASQVKLSEKQIVVTTPSGSLEVSEDCLGIAQLILDEGLDIMVRTHEDIASAAERYLAGERKIPARSPGGVVPVPVSVPRVEAELAAPAPILPGTPISITISIYSILTGALQLARLDKLPGSRDRKLALEAVAEQYAATLPEVQKV